MLILYSTFHNNKIYDNMNTKLGQDLGMFVIKNIITISIDEIYQ